MILNTEQKPVERVVETAFARIKTLVDGDTVIGRPMTMEDGTTIVPISRVTLGMLTGGGEYGEAGVSSYPFAGEKALSLIPDLAEAIADAATYEKN